MKIDLNCDMGEGMCDDALSKDRALLEEVTSANIACGFHAGGPEVMRLTVQAAMEKGVAIGAHPGLPDREGFGRREMRVSPHEVYELVLYQVGALFAFVKAAGGTLQHVKAHGALYNMAARDVKLADALAQAVFDFDPALLLYGLAGSELINAAEQRGIRPVPEVFADRTYQDDGSLTPRTHSDALITNEQQALDQAVMLVKRQQAIAVSGKVVPIKAETICLHGDGTDALAFAHLIKDSLEREGVAVRSPLNNRQAL